MNLNNDMIIVCEMQGRMFEEASKKFKCGSGTFIYHFMYSNLAEKLDDPNYLALFDPIAYDEQLLGQYPSLNNENGNKIDDKIMHWIGYIYRATSYIKEMPSKLLFQYMDYKELINLYNVYHTFGIDYCVTRLTEHFDLDNKNSPDIKSMIKDLYKSTLINLKNI